MGGAAAVTEGDVRKRKKRMGTFGWEGNPSLVRKVTHRRFPMAFSFGRRVLKFKKRENFLSPISPFLLPV